MFTRSPFRNTMAPPGRKTKIVSAVLLVIILLASAGLYFYIKVLPGLDKTRTIRAVSSRLTADSRKATIQVSGVVFDPSSRENVTSVEYTEYGVKGRTLKSRTLSFSGDVIQVQSLVMDFSGLNTKNSEYLKDRKACLFWKAFLPEGDRVKQVELTKINTVPRAYGISPEKNAEETAIWKALWDYALDGKSSSKISVKNVKISANDRIFIPGTVYTLRLGRDGSLKVDTDSLISK
ncbi:MAG: hypothetical protein GF409_06770 [Candidatus Omnitrophica bacterium]|nr:hypothetical protein [Candidatus Omnitrophota bacterium]